MVSRTIGFCLVLAFRLFDDASGFRPLSLLSLNIPSRTRHNKQSACCSVTLSASPNSDADKSRRQWGKKAYEAFLATLTGSALLTWSRPAWATTKSRTDGYQVRHSETEWKSMLSPMQYKILRQGGTERPGSSRLEPEDRAGIFACAGCGSELFAASDKFHSGTGWPSFARGITDTAIEVEELNPISAKLGGAELRCSTCGGHLGDVFQDGFLFVGTEAFKTGKRYCIDGAALVFYPQDGGVAVRGDMELAKLTPGWLEPPKITPSSKQTE
jgi:peptide-methionine (R)-S-oxide reductase